MTDQQRGYECKTEILDKILSVMEHTTEKHNKVLAVRVDLRFPKDKHYPNDNKLFSKFTSPFVKDLKRQKLDPYYVAVREQSKEKHQHYHLVVFVDGNKVKFPNKVIKAAEKHWGKTVNDDKRGLVEHCTKSRSGEKQTNFYRLRRNDSDYEEHRTACFHRCSYLAKVNTKGKTAKREREVFGSQVPKKH